MLQKVALSALLVGVTLNEALAGFGWGRGFGWPRHAPEIDGSGALAVFAVVVSVGAIIYRKLR